MQGRDYLINQFKPPHQPLISSYIRGVVVWVLLNKTEALIDQVLDLPTMEGDNKLRGVVCVGTTEKIKDKEK